MKSLDDERLASGPVVCGAKTRKGTPCQRVPLRGRKRCRLHGGLSPGAPRGTSNGNYKNGYWTADAVQERKWVREMIKVCVMTRPDK